MESYFSELVESCEVLKNLTGISGIIFSHGFQSMMELLFDYFLLWKDSNKGKTNENTMFRADIFEV